MMVGKGWPLLVALLAFCALCGAFRTAKKDKIVFAIDYNKNLNPTRTMHLTHALFDIHILRNAAEITRDIDVLAFANFTALSNLYHARGVKLSTYVENDPVVIERFEDKSKWKSWMKEIGLGDSVPAILDPSKDPNAHAYPLVLKTSAHFGRGVFVVHNGKDLRNLTKSLTAAGKTYLLEEALTALGLSEVTMWGSAFRGKLLSLRCLKQTYTQQDLQHSAFKNTTQAKTANSTNSLLVPFVRGFQAKSRIENWVPCGKDVVGMVRGMTEASYYTGSFCSGIKLDAQMRPKLLEVNARYCGTMAGNDALFVTAFVPLAVEIGRSMPNAKINRALNNGTAADIFRQIKQHEERVLLTGGGIVDNDRWLTVDHFDPNLRLDVIKDHFHRLIQQHQAETGAHGNFTLP